MYDILTSAMEHYRMNIIGHEKIRNHLEDAIARDTLSHAYLFCGPNGVGKRTVADWIIRLLKPSEHTTLERLVSEKGVRAAAISVEQVRDAITSLNQTTFDGGVRVILIDEAERLTDAASNALLKSLEEPPARTHFFLIAHDASAVLGTIRSRCMGISFGLVPEDKIAAAINHPDAARIAHCSAGRPGIALTLAHDGALADLESRRERLAQLLSSSLPIALRASDDIPESDSTHLEALIRDMLHDTTQSLDVSRRLYESLRAGRMRSDGQLGAAFEYMIVRHV